MTSHKRKRPTKGALLLLGLAPEVKEEFKIACMRKQISMLKGVGWLMRRALKDPALLEDPDGAPEISG